MGGAGCYIAEKIGNAHNCEVVAINDSHSTLTDKKAHHKLNLNLELAAITNCSGVGMRQIGRAHV